MLLKKLLFRIAFFALPSGLFAFSFWWMQKTFETDQTAGLATYGLLPKWIMDAGIPLWILGALVGFAIATSLWHYLKRKSRKSLDELQRKQQDGRPSFAQRLEDAQRDQQDGNTAPKEGKSRFAQRLETVQREQQERFRQKRQRTTPLGQEE